MTDVVVIGYKGRKWLPECISTLRMAGNQFRLILVDNGPDIGIADLQLDQVNSIVLSTPHAMGFAEANNFALINTPDLASTICFLNQDTQSQPGWLEECVCLLRDVPQLGAVAPLLKTFDGRQWDPGFLMCAKQSTPFWNAIDTAKFHAWYEVPEVTAAAIVIRTDAILAAGPFDPIFGSYYEDFDLCRRIREQGYQIGICTKATVNHYSGSSTDTPEAERKRMRQIIRNRCILKLRYRGTERCAAACRQFIISFPHGLMRGILRTPSSQPPTVQLGSHLDLLKILPRISSKKRDDQIWQEYLREIGWPKSANRKGTGRTLDSNSSPNATETSI